MVKAVRRARVGGLLLLAVLGCAPFRPSAPSRGGPVPSDPTDRRPTPVMLGGTDARGTILRASFDPTGDPARRAAGGDGPYLDLTPEVCQCLAARHSTVANLLDLKPLEISEDDRCRSRARRRAGDPLGSLLRELVWLGGLEARNRAAGEALELFYRLAGVEARRGLLRRSLAEVDDTLARNDLARQRGLPLPIREGELQRRRLELLGDDLELQLARGRLDGELRLRLKLDADRPIRPVAPVEVRDEPIDPGAAVSIGLARRPEILVLRRLHQALSVETLSAVRHVLGRVDGFLGMDLTPALGGGSRLCPLLRARSSDDADALLCTARRQLEGLILDRERDVAEEIAQAVRTVQARREQIELGRRQVESWSAEVAKAEARTAQGIGSFAEGAPAKSGAFKAEGEVIDREVAWNIARAKVRQAQGILAEECMLMGY